VKAQWTWTGTTTCKSNVCDGLLTLNNTHDVAIFYSPDRYDIKLNYITSSPVGVNLTVQRTGKEATNIFLTSSVISVDNLDIELSEVDISDRTQVVLFLKIKEPVTTTTRIISVATTLAPISREGVPEGAYDLRGITEDKYSVSYLGYQFKINQVTYIDTVQGSVKVDVMKPNGTVTTVECSAEFQEKVDDLIIGAYPDSKTHKLIVWVYKPQ